jgi:hypothetical protein
MAATLTAAAFTSRSPQMGGDDGFSCFGGTESQPKLALDPRAT